MFDYAFANYQAKPIVGKGTVLDDQISVIGGKKDKISVEIGEEAYIFGARGEKIEHNVEVEMDKIRKAPIEKGDKVGEMIIYKNNVESDRVAIVAGEDCPSAKFIDNWRKVTRSWTIR